jgi:hypothetical protein
LLILLWKNVILFPENSYIFAKYIVVFFVSIRKLFNVYELWHLPEPPFYNAEDYKMMMFTGVRFNTVVNLYISAQAVATGVGIFTAVTLPAAVYHNRTLAYENIQLKESISNMKIEAALRDEKLGLYKMSLKDAQIASDNANKRVMSLEVEKQVLDIKLKSIVKTESDRIK